MSEGLALKLNVGSQAKYWLTSKVLAHTGKAKYLTKSQAEGLANPDP